jgi:hypothetical protein
VRLKHETIDFATKVLIKHMRMHEHVPFTGDVLNQFLSKFAEESDDFILLDELKIFKLSASILMSRHDDRMLKPV